MRGECQPSGGVLKTGPSNPQVSYDHMALDCRACPPREPSAPQTLHRHRPPRHPLPENRTCMSWRGQARSVSMEDTCGHHRVSVRQNGKGTQAGRPRVWEQGPQREAEGLLKSRDSTQPEVAGCRDTHRGARACGGQRDLTSGDGKMAANLLTHTDAQQGTCQQRVGSRCTSGLHGHRTSPERTIH